MSISHRSFLVSSVVLTVSGGLTWCPQPVFAMAENTDVSKAEDAPVFYAADGVIELIVHHEHERKRIESWLSDFSQKLFDEMGITYHREEEGVSWKITIEIYGTVFKNELQLAATHDGEPVPEVSIHEQCACNTEDLLKIAEERLRSTVRTLRDMPSSSPVSQPTVAAVPSHVQEESPPIGLKDNAPQNQPLSPQRWGGLGRLGIAGIVVAGSGTVPFGIGLARRLQDPMRTTNPEGVFTRTYETPASNALFGLGIATMGAGALMLIIDLAVCGQRSRGCRGRSSLGAQVSGWGTRF